METVTVEWTDHPELNWPITNPKSTKAVCHQQSIILLVAVPPEDKHNL